jgi:hypothetical protein
MSFICIFISTLSQLKFSFDLTIVESFAFVPVMTHYWLVTRTDEEGTIPVVSIVLCKLDHLLLCTRRTEIFLEPL